MFAPLNDETTEKAGADNSQELEGFNFSINKCAELLDLDRRTVKKRVQAAELKPKGNHAGFPVYQLAEVARACFIGEQKKAKYKVELLGPKERAEHFMAEKRELEVLEKKRELIPYDEAAEKFAELGQTFAKFFDTFMDDLEQTQLFDVTQLEEMQELCDDQRTVFAKAEF